MKKRGQRRVLIRKNYQRIKVNKALETMVKVLEEWRSFSQKKNSMLNKIQFLRIEGKSKKKKNFFKFWLKKSKNVRIYRELKENVDQIREDKIKMKIFIVWKAEIQNIIEKKKKNNEVFNFFQKKKLEKLFDKIRENAIFHKKMKKIGFFIKSRHLSIEKLTILTKWLEFTRKNRKSDYFNEITLKKKAFWGIFMNFREVSLKIQFFSNENLRKKVFFALKIFRIQMMEKGLLQKKRLFFEKNIENNMKNTVFSVLLRNLHREKYVYLSTTPLSGSFHKYSTNLKCLLLNLL